MQKHHAPTGKDQGKKDQGKKQQWNDNNKGKAPAPTPRKKPVPQQSQGKKAPAPAPPPQPPGPVVTVRGAQNSARIVQKDLVGGNVTIHAIDSVLLPPTVFITVRDALKFSDSTSAFLVLADNATTVQSLIKDPTTNVTLFAPTTQAVMDVGSSGTDGRVLMDPKRVADILAYHAVKGARVLPPYGTAAGTTEWLQTLLPGQSLRLTKTINALQDGNGTSVGSMTVQSDVDGSPSFTVRKYNIIAGASMINVIDGLLVPSKLK